MQKQRLLKLAKFLRDVVPARRFNLHFIGRRTNQKVKVAPVPQPNAECGYAGCAIGWTPSAFPRSGWKIAPFYENSNVLEAQYTDSKGNTYDDFRAAEHFYGLSNDQAEFLFDPVRYPISKRGRKSVAERIEKFVESNGASVTDTEYYD